MTFQVGDRVRAVEESFSYFGPVPIGSIGTVIGSGDELTQVRWDDFKHGECDHFHSRLEKIENTFSVGDRIRVKENDSILDAGRMGTVTEVGDSELIGVRFDDMDYDQDWFPWRFEKVTEPEPEAPFAVGDRVRVVDDGFGCLPFNEGDEGTVTRVWSDSEDDYLDVHFDGEPYPIGGWFLSRFEKVVEPEFQLPEIHNLHMMTKEQVADLVGILQAYQNEINKSYWDINKRSANIVVRDGQYFVEWSEPSYSWTDLYANKNGELRWRSTN